METEESNRMAVGGQTRETEVPARLTAGAIIKQGLRKAWSGSLWMYKIVFPVSFLTFLLDRSRVIDSLEGFLGPVMQFVHLPADAAMPLLAGMLTGIYGGIAAMSALDFTLREATLIAIFLLSSHALIQESIIQGQSGMRPFKAAGLRLAVSTMMIWIIGHLWDVSPATGSLAGALSAAQPVAFATALKGWAVASLKLSLQILLILIAVMTLMAWMKARNMTERLVGMLSPVLTVMGIRRKAGLMWLAANLFGISFGGAVIVSEAKTADLSREYLQDLHLSIGINHSVIEDPALFLPMGIHPFWLWIPRLIAAVAAVHLQRACRGIMAILARPAVDSAVSGSRPHTDKDPVRPPG